VRKVRAFLVCAVLALAASPPAATAAGLHCGDSVTADTVLTADISECDSGLFVVRDGVTLDLNGHTVSGTQRGFGIAVAGRRAVTIQNGTVSGFRVEVSVSDSSDVTVRDMSLTGGHDGATFFGVARGTLTRSYFSGNDASAAFAADATDLRIAGNTARRNGAGFSGIDVTGGTVAGNTVNGQTFYGLIFLNSIGVVFEENRFEENGGVGMQIGGDASADDLVARNRAWRNGADGIEVAAPGSTLTRNTAFFNGGFGIDAGAGVLDGGGNHAKHNGAPAQCAGIACK